MKNKQTLFYIILLLLASCHRDLAPVEIAEKTIKTVDTVSTVYYRQKQFRGNTANPENERQTERTFCYDRLITDSITGARAHICFYDSVHVFGEDIYDGNRLIRKHNDDSTAIVYDLLKYPDLKKKPFWGKTSPYVIQYMLKYAIENKEHYQFVREADETVNGKDCYCLKTILEKKALMPGFYKYTVDTNRVETMILFIDKESFYPQRMRMEVYFYDNPDDVYYVDNTFLNLKFNVKFSDSLFNTSDEVIDGFEITEVKP